jgi:hypothetical protein
MEMAYAFAREAGLWRFDRRWRSSADRLRGSLARVCSARLLRLAGGATAPGRDIVPAP